MFASVVYLAAWFTELAPPGTSALVNVLASLPILIAKVSTDALNLAANRSLEPIQMSQRR